MIVSDYALVKKRERQWYLRHAVWRARKAGAKFADIARTLGVSRNRVYQIYWDADEDVRGRKRSPLTEDLFPITRGHRSQLMRNVGWLIRMQERNWILTE